MKFRTLNADEIEVRVQQVTEKGAILLLYKDARCDMRVLDEVVGPTNWQRKHYELKGNIYASVGIKAIAFEGGGNDSDEWIWKDDAGAESNTEAVKGEASDSFKRACFNWGIGRELYTSPFIWVDVKNITTYKNMKTGKLGTYDKFEIEAIEYDDGVIKALAIRNKKTKTHVYGWRSA